MADGQTLFREGLAALLATARGLAVVDAVANVDRAVDRAAKLGDHVSIWSVKLPERNAFHAARGLLVKHPEAKIIFLDDAPLDAHVQMAWQAGAVGYATRQETFAKLLAATRRAAAGETSFPRRMKRIDPEAGAAELGRKEVPAGTAEQLASLTPRELEVLAFLARGLTVREAAKAMYISKHTVDNHKTRMMKKLGLHKTVELTRLAIREGLVEG